MMVTLSPSVFEPFEAFTCYNSPYLAHEDGRAIDLYPDGEFAPSPVAGEVVFIDRVRAPWQPYARAFDYVIGIDTANGSMPIADADHGPSIARVLHVDPTVSIGDQVDVGEPLGCLIRAGFFAPWVDTHLHVGFRPPGRDLRRAGGSLPLSFNLDIAGLGWDGTGEVEAVGRTFIELRTDLEGDMTAPWVGLMTAGGQVLDGGMPHYECGGLLAANTVGGSSSPIASADDTVRFLETTVGWARGRAVEWADISVRVNETAITGLSLFCARPEHFHVKLICPGHSFTIGTPVEVTIDRSP